MTLQFEALKVALKQDATGYILTLRLHPDEIPEELLRDFVGARYMIAAVRVDDNEDPVIKKTRVMKAGMLCKNPAFQEWLLRMGYAKNASETAAVNAVYTMCNISSRTELNGNKQAQEIFDKLVEEYGKESTF